MEREQRPATKCQRRNCGDVEHIDSITKAVIVYQMVTIFLWLRFAKIVFNQFSYIHFYFAIAYAMSYLLSLVEAIRNGGRES